MKRSFFFFSIILLLLSSCRDQDFDWRMNRLSKYGQQFVNQYGWPDERQTWNTAIQYSLNANIEMGGTWTMLVYSADPLEEPRKSYILGRYTVDAAEAMPADLKFDGPYTLESVCVGISNGTVSSRKNIATNSQAKIEVTFTEEDMQEGGLYYAPDMSYLLAYEIVDTLSNYLDFNDIVLEVEHVSGEETANVKLRAVGAKQEMQVRYINGDEKIVLFEEAHAAFGYLNVERLVNVDLSMHSYRTPIKYVNLNVGKDFSIAQNAGRFVVYVPGGKKNSQHNFYLLPSTEEYVGLPSNVLSIANPTWDWISEGGAFNLERSSFTFWLKSYRLYNQWWDNLWDPHELVIAEGDSYRPDFDYLDMIAGAEEIRANNGLVPDIDFTRLYPYAKEKIGANIAFVITGREGADVTITLQRSDDGPFEWYDDKAFVHVFENYNVDGGRGYAEACHILLSTATIQDIVNNRARLRVYFDKEDSEAEINSVWIRGR